MEGFTQEIQQIKPSLSGLNKISIISHPFLVDQGLGADLSGSGHLTSPQGYLEVLTWHDTWHPRQSKIEATMSLYDSFKGHIPSFSQHLIGYTDCPAQVEEDYTRTWMLEGEHHWRPFEILAVTFIF